MHYYAIINEEYTVMEVTSSDTIINDDWYIEITEEQYNDEGFIGSFYDQDKDEFVGGAMWIGTTNEVRYNETYRTLTGKLNEIDEEIATHTHTGYVTSGELQTIEDNLQTLEDVIDTKANSNHQHTEYAPASHSHTEYALQTSLDTLGEELATKSDSTHNHSGVYDVSGAAASALTSANTYTDSKINALVGSGASTTLDTIGEISAAIEDNQDMIDTLNSAIGNKANATDLTSHTGNTTVHITSSERNSWNAKSDFSGNYNDLTNKPTIPSIDGLATETYVDSQINAIVIPDALSDLTADSTHRTVTDAEKVAWNAKSNFSGSYNDLTNKPTIPSISGLATETYVDEAVSTKANSSHTHDDRYYTETEINTKLSTKSDSTHNHNASYDALGAANTALVSAKDYTDDAIADEVTARDSAIATAKSSAISTASSDATTKITSHNTSTSAHNDIRVLVADLTTKLNNFLDVDDTTTDELSEVLTLINNNKGTLESLTTSKINTSDIVNNLTTNSTSKVLSAAQGVAIKSLINALQTELDDGFEEITSEKIQTLFSN